MMNSESSITHYTHNHPLAYKYEIKRDHVFISLEMKSYDFYMFVYT